MGTLEKTLSVYELNQLIEESFGRGFKCNYVPVGMSVLTEGFEEVDHPAMIAKEGWILDHGAGWFGDENHNNSEDGSVITVSNKYLKNALTYSKLYQEKTGKKVRVHLVSKNNSI